MYEVCIVWEDCIQEEARVANREALLREHDQDLAILTKGRKQSNFKKGSHKTLKNKFQKKRENNHKKDYSKYQCYKFHNIGHLSKEYPLNNNNNKIHHAHLAEDEDEEERPQKRLTKEEYVEEYVVFSALSGYVTPREDTWLIDSGASEHMTEKKQNISKLEENNSPRKISLGDDYQYPIKGICESIYKLDSQNLHEDEGSTICTKFEKESTFHLSTR